MKCVIGVNEKKNYNNSIFIQIQLNTIKIESMWFKYTHTIYCAEN